MVGTASFWKGDNTERWRVKLERREDTSLGQRRR